MRLSLLIVRRTVKELRKRAIQLDRQLHGQCVFCAVSVSEDHRIGCPQIRCRYCTKRLPNEEEAYWTKTFKAEKGQEALDQVNSQGQKEFCVCSSSLSSLWRRDLFNDNGSRSHEISRF